ncbi:unnamed protein product [Prunus armeniaca]
MEWLVYCAVLSIGFHSKLTKLLLSLYYDVPNVLDSIPYLLIPEIGQFKFVRSSFSNGFGLNPISIGPRIWTIQFYGLDFTQNSSNESSHHIMMFPKFWTQSDIDWSTKLDNSGSYEVRSEMEWLVCCIVLSIGFHSQLSGRLHPPYYGVPQVYPQDFTQNSPNDSSHHIMMFPKFWTQSDIYWTMNLDNSGSYEGRSKMEWLVYCVVLWIGFHSKLIK